VNKKSLLSVFFTATLIGGLFLANAMRFGTVHAYKDVTGIIFSDTTWTKANSPINITGPTAIAKGVTVTIEPGVVVHFNLNTLEVNGTLRAIGTSAEPITLDGDWQGRGPYFGSSDYNGILTFTSESNGWNVQTETGCIIENVNVISLSIYVHNVSVKMSNNVFSGNHAWGGLSTEGGDSIISNNEITGGLVSVDGGSPVFNNNTIIGQQFSVQGGSPNILGNLFYGEHCGIFIAIGTDMGANVMITDNILANCSGIQGYGGNITLEHNLLLYTEGCVFYGAQMNVIILNNTIAFNEVGIDLPPSPARIVYNNLENNNQKNLLAPSGSLNFDATYNWWGTTDASAISQTIVDYKTDYHLGNVTFIPFLDAPNPQAPSISSFVEPSPSPSPSPSLSPTPFPSPATTPTPTPTQEPQQTEQPEIIIGVAITVAVIGAGMVLLIYLIKRK
jgi:hypothetical protein